MNEQVLDNVSNIYYPPMSCRETRKSSSPLRCVGATVYTQVKLPPLVPPWKWGKPEKLVPSPIHRGGLGWGITVIKIQDNTL